MKKTAFIAVFLLYISTFLILSVQANPYEQDKWSQAMRLYTIKNNIVKPDKKITIVKEIPYQYIMGRNSKPCFDTSKWKDPNKIYRDEDWIYDKNLPLSDIIETNPSEITMQFQTQGPRSDRLC